MACVPTATKEALMIGRRACLAIWLAGLPIANPIGRAQSVQPAPLRLALKGYDPVAYFTAGRPTAGKPEYEAVYDGARYHFASARSLELFKADPDRYAPQYAGACTAGIAMGVKVESDPEQWQIVDGKLFVFSSAATADAMRRDPEGMIVNAREHWKTLASAPYQ
jgi:YHS domain-containing protein